MPTSIQTATVAVPLLFVVVTELNAAGREIDLEAIAKSDESSASIFTSLAKRIRFPQLGRFNLIHGMNTVLLAGALVLQSGLLTGEGVLRFVLLGVTWLGWVILPALEIPVHDEIFRERVSMGHPVHVHVLGTLVGVVYIGFPPSSWMWSHEVAGIAGWGVLILFSTFRHRRHRDARNRLRFA